MLETVGQLLQLTFSARIPFREDLTNKKMVTHHSLSLIPLEDKDLSSFKFLAAVRHTLVCRVNAY
jgi:hypothetical protein